MKIIKPGFKIMTPLDGTAILHHIQHLYFPRCRNP